MGRALLYLANTCGVDPVEKIMRIILRREFKYG